MNKEYLGSVDPRHALRILKLMRGGNKYFGHRPQFLGRPNCLSDP